jgi:hypothetical protein
MHGLSLFLALAFASAPTAADEALCPPRFQLEHPERCLDRGPGEYAERVAAARVPVVAPELPVTFPPIPNEIVPFTYAQVTTPDAPLFASPEDAAAGVVKRALGRGFIYVNLINPIQQGDQVLYKIRTGEYIRASDVNTIKPTNFRGVSFYGSPTYPFGWIVANVRPSSLPGVEASREVVLVPRRTVVQIYATVRVGVWDWYLIGPNQWIEQRTISKVNFNAPPEGITGKWVQVDLYEQTMVAYEDNHPVYATLVSSGLDRWATEPGLFHIWSRLRTDGMSGAYERDGSDYYYLEAVPWVMYFDGDRALHGQYWHDRLGFKRSHGCVNLAPLDARWLYDWAEVGTPVWVYDPSGQKLADAVAVGP